MYILGIHIGHDSTAVLLKDGEVMEAMSEERLSRAKKHRGFPFLSIAYIKQKYGINSIEEVVVVGMKYGHEIFATAEQNLESRKHGSVPADNFLRAIGFRYPLLNKVVNVRDKWVEKRAYSGVEEKLKALLTEQFPSARITRIEHHLAHAWATTPFLPDTKKPYLILTLDGAGDDLSGSINIYKDGKIERKHSILIKDSIGLLYAAVVDLLGMARNEHEFKVMGLAPYAKASAGEKVYEKLKELVSFDSERMTFVSKIPLNRATPYLIANNYYLHRFDSLAYGIQKLAEESIKEMVRASVAKYGMGDIAVGGGVFMNVKANQYVREMNEVKSFIVTPSCGDESLAIGAAIYRYSERNKGDLGELKTIENLYLGSEYTDEEIKKAIDDYDLDSSIKVSYCDPKDDENIEYKVAELLAKNSVVGRFKGRAEWGARALGNRSILANPTSRENVKLINEMIKGRDFWMPFATSILYERRHDYLEGVDDYVAPYMAITFNTKPKAHKDLIAALHPYDLTSRPQMVQKQTNPEYHALISNFEKLTGVGGILNTSFNLHGEPNVEKPIDALRTFVLSGLPHLAIGNYLLSKE
ncbi:MAG: hypothetical protein H6779_01660 [Candidatus Nomurabacteria bacterium]|nr:hypothetical protein [Candidatus Nomurabacteria bacterium]USN88135.1 MAG: hypothetical protein H6779_01660 [Candidatus Nomurabacteria bacterium]